MTPLERDFIRVFGGPGSGNFGHGGRLGEIGGSSDMFHGTTTDIAQKIKKQGIKPADGDEAYVAIDEITAFTYGMRRATDSGKKQFAVVTVSKNTPGLKMDDGFATSKTTIDAKYIKEIRVYNTKQFVDVWDSESGELAEIPKGLKPLKTLAEAVVYVTVFTKQ